MSIKANKPRFGDYLDHILEAVELAIGYCEGLEREDFLADRKTQQAVLLNLLIIGEAATKICHEYPEFVAHYPAVPWKPMRGMRNRLAHGYFEVNFDIVWDTVRTALPDLAASIREAGKTSESGRRYWSDGVDD